MHTVTYFLYPHSDGTRSPCPGAPPSMLSARSSHRACRHPSCNAPRPFAGAHLHCWWSSLSSVSTSAAGGNALIKSNCSSHQFLRCQPKPAICKEHAFSSYHIIKYIYADGSVTQALLESCCATWNSQIAQYFAIFTRLLKTHLVAKCNCPTVLVVRDGAQIPSSLN